MEDQIMTYDLNIKVTEIDLVYRTLSAFGQIIFDLFKDSILGSIRLNKCTFFLSIQNRLNHIRVHNAFQHFVF